MLTLAGVLPPIPTPFDADGDVDEDALARNLAFLSRFLLSGYVVLGSNGESVHLTESEKLRLIESVRGIAPDDRAVVAGTGLFSTRATIALTQSAAKAGADAALVLPPFYYRGQMTSDALRDHFVAIADASAIPVLIYNMPANTSIDLSADLLCELSLHENIAGLKDSSGNMAKLAELRSRVNPGFALLAGSAGFFLPALSAGAVGGVLALANIAPDACLEINSLAKNGDWDAARRVQNRLARANRAVTRQWGVPALKAAMDLLGLRGGLPRSPLMPLSTEYRQELASILAEAGIHHAKEIE